MIVLTWQNTVDEWRAVQNESRKKSRLLCLCPWPIGLVGTVVR
jgi:hypothetical protein